MKKNVAIILVLLPSLLSFSLLADTLNEAVVEEEEVFPLPEIAVSAKRIPAPPTVIVREVQVDDMTAWNAATAGDALTYVPGVNVLVGGGSADSRLWIRGFRDRDLLLLFDGIPIASSFEGSFNLDEIALESISSIKVLKSAPSVIYGTNGLGGVVDVIPAVGRSDSFLNATAELGTDDRRLLRVSGGGGNSNVSYSLAGQHQQADNYSLSDDFVPTSNQPAGQRINSDYQRSNLLFLIDALDSPIGHSSLVINLTDSEKGMPPQAGTDDPDFERLTESKRTTIGFSNHFSSIPLSMKLYYNGYDSELTSYTDISYLEVDEVEAASDYSWGGKLYSTIATSTRNSLILKAGIQSDTFEAAGELENRDKAELLTYTLAAEDEYWLNERLSLAAAAIYTYFDQTTTGETSSAFNPQLALGWQISEALQLHASAAQRTRYPKMRELYRRRYGNPDLEPQTANNYELGFSWHHSSGLTGDFAFYRSDVDDLIERPDRRSQYQNLDRVTLQGVETAAGGWLTSEIFLRLGYTYLQADEELPEGGSRQLRSRPEHTLVGEFRYRFPRNIQLSFNGIFVKGLYDLDPEDVYFELPGFFLANLKATMPFAGHYQAYIAVSNLFDTDYMQRYGYPREGRAIKAGLALGF